MSPRQCERRACGHRHTTSKSFTKPHPFGNSMGAQDILWEPPKSHTNALVWSMLSLDMKRGFGLMIGTFGCTFLKEVVGVRFSPLASSIPLTKDFYWKVSPKLREKLEVEISSNQKFSRLCSRGREARSWDNIEAFRYIRSQLAAHIFLAHDHMEALTMTWVRKNGEWWKHGMTRGSTNLNPKVINLTWDETLAN